MGNPIPLYQFTKNSSIQFLLITPDAALVFDKQGALIAVSKDPNDVLLSRISDPSDVNLTDDMLYDEITEVLCDTTDTLVVWHDFYIGTPHFETANILHALYKQGIYTGYVPILAEVSWCILYALLDTNKTQAQEEIDIRPVLDTFTHEDLAQLKKQLDLNEIDAIVPIIRTCIDRYLLTYNPISPWPGYYQAEPSIPLLDYIETYRAEPDTEDTLRDAEKRLNQLTTERIAKLKRTLNEANTEFTNRYTQQTND